jgi:riboflavin biosynthesis pyrimidine reductase
MTRLSPSDPLCLSPALAGVRTGAVAVDDPRLEVSASQLAGYLSTAPQPVVLDMLEVETRSAARVVRQVSPGVYVVAWRNGTVDTIDARGAR